MAEVPELRISDDDRERVAAVLRDAFADGRISQGELDDRLGVVYAARTAGELEPVVADLPAVQRQVPAVGRGRDRRSILPQGWQAFTFAPLICTAIYLMTNPGGYFWPMWVWFGCSIPLLASVLFRR